ncbi:hypothetical protein [Coleofasciculus sp. F4-SAH-05]
MVIGHWSLVIGHWSLVIGHWSFIICHLSFVKWNELTLTKISQISECYSF